MSEFDNATAITKSDTTTYDPPLEGFFVGGAGDVAVRTKSGTTLTLSGCLAGHIYPIVVDRIMSANTSATGIVGLRHGPRL